MDNSRETKRFAGNDYIGDINMSVPVIALDAGHGYNTKGKRCLKSLDPNETREWVLNDRIMDRVQEKLSHYNCVSLRVDDTTGKNDVSLQGRVSLANKKNAVIYISVHHDAGLNGRKGGGTTVFYCSSQFDRYSQAKRLYNFVIDKTRLYGDRSQKIINKGYFVLRNTKMPAFLIENGFMDSKDDINVILSEEHAENTAEGIASFLVTELGLSEKTNEVAVEEEKTNIYFPKYNGAKTTLSDAMSKLQIDNSYAYRKKIAKANKIERYSGTAKQNIQMYNMLVAGILIKPY